MTRLEDIKRLTKRSGFWLNLIVAVIVFFLLGYGFKQIKIGAAEPVFVEVRIKAPSAIRLLLFYQPDTLEAFSDQLTLSSELSASASFQIIRFELPRRYLMKRLRLDLGDNATMKALEIESVKISKAGNEFVLFDPSEKVNYFWMNDHISYKSGTVFSLHEKSGLFDPYMISEDIGKSYQQISKSSKSIPYSYLLAFILVFPAFLFFTFFRPPTPAMSGFYSMASVLFVAMLLSPFINEIFEFVPNVSTEKRTLKEKPKFNTSNALNYPKEFEAYYNDNFGFRSLLVGWAGNKKYHWFSSSASPSKVAVGKDGWLFLTGELYKVTQELTRKNLYTPKELKEAAKTWEARKAWLNNQGIFYFKAFSPDKYHVYPEYMPLSMSLITKDTVFRCDQAINYLSETKSPVHIIDMRPRLLKAKRTVQVYHCFDSHWNEYGAYVAYYELMTNISKEMPELRPHELTQFELTWGWQNAGDLAGILGLEVEEWAPSLVLKKDSARISKGDVTGFPEKTMIFENAKAETNLTLLMYRDSYTVALIPFLQSHFKRMVLIWNSPYSEEMVQRVKPNLVIENYASRYFK